MPAEPQPFLQRVRASGVDHLVEEAVVQEAIAGRTDRPPRADRHQLGHTIAGDTIVRNLEGLIPGASHDGNIRPGNRQILSAELLAVPRLGAINVHASILPKYRGAAPIQTAILQGESETGITIFQIEPKLDAGPILGIERTPIGPKETSGELESRLSILGAVLALRVVDQIAAGTSQPIIQDSTQASRAPRLKKESGRIDWNRSPRQIDCQVRALHPWPLAYSTLSLRSDKAGEGGAIRSVRLIVLEVAPA